MDPLVLVFWGHPWFWVSIGRNLNLPTSEYGEYLSKIIANLSFK